MVGISLTNPGDRTDRVTEERATELIDRWEVQIQQAENDSFIETLDLACRVYEVGAAKLICDYLKDKVSQVTTANLPDIIASLHTDDGLAVLRGFSELLQNSPITTINLDDNALGIRGIIECRGMLSCISLVDLSLQNNGLDTDSMFQLKDILLDDSQDNGCVANNLRSLKIYNNMIGVEGARQVGLILAHCKNLKYFRYEGCRPLSEGTGYLVDGLAAAARAQGFDHPLETLLLELSLGCGEDDPISPLCLILPMLSELKHLRLYDCGLEAEGCDRVLRSLRASTGLQVLEMAQNEMAAENLKLLTNVIKNNSSTLKELNIESNEITSVGVERLVKAFRSAKNGVALESLKLKENMIGERGAAALIAAQEKGLFPNLTLLDLDENGFSEDTVERLQDCFGDILKEMDSNDDEEEFDDELSENSEEGSSDEEEENNIDELGDALAGVTLTPDDVSL